MTVVGILLIVAGAVVGLTSGTPFDGQWLLGFCIALVGLALCTIHSKEHDG